jgi:hypothetical protein
VVQYVQYLDTIMKKFLFVFALFFLSQSANAGLLLKYRLPHAPNHRKITKIIIAATTVLAAEEIIKSRAIHQPKPDDYEIQSNAVALRRALNAEIEKSSVPFPPPQDPKDCAAHHIVPQRENRYWARNDADLARSAIKECVEIDAAENGIYLPTSDNAQCQGTKHNNLHSKKYYRDISSRLSFARRNGQCEGVKRELSQIKKELFNGRIW